MNVRWIWVVAALLPFFARAEEPIPQPAKLVPLASSAVFLDLAATGSRVVAVGERGIVIYSDDAGATWTQAKVPVNGTLTSVAFRDAKNGYAVGHDATILKTVNAGETWEVVHFDPGSQNLYLTIKFRRPDVGYVLGTNGQLLITRDGGGSWQAQTLAVEDWYQNHLFDIVWSGDGAIVVAEKGVIYRSADGQTGWAPVTSPYDGSWFGAQVLPNSLVAIYGMSGRLYLSKDLGINWQSIKTGTHQFLLDGVVLDDGRLLLVGAGGVISVVDPVSGVARTTHRPDRVGITSGLALEGHVFLATTAGGVGKVSLEELLAQ